jgi:hypothetical protein
MRDPMIMGFPAAASRRGAATRYRPGGELNPEAVGAVVIGPEGLSSRVYVNGVETPRDADGFVPVPANTRLRLNVHTFDTVYSVRLWLKEAPPRRLVVGEDIPAAQRRGAVLPVTAMARLNLLRFDAGEVMVDGMTPARQEAGEAGMQSIWVPAGRHEIKLIGPGSGSPRYATVEVDPAEIRDMVPFDFAARSAPAPTLWVPGFIPGFLFTAAPGSTPPATSPASDPGEPPPGPPEPPPPPEPDPTGSEPLGGPTDPPEPDPTWPDPTDAVEPDPTEPEPTEPDATWPAVDPDGGTPKPTVPPSPFVDPGLVEFAVGPADAVVALNGAPLPTGSKSASMAPGTYPLRITAAGYKTYDATVTVRSGFVSTVRVNLERASSPQGGAKPAPKGMSGGAKAAIGVVALAVTGGAAWGGYRWWKRRQIEGADGRGAGPASTPRAGLPRPPRPSSR